MTKVDRIVVGCLVTYILIGALTFGVNYNINVNRDCGLKPDYGTEEYDKHWDKWFDCDWSKKRGTPEAAIAGIAWPFYFLGKTAIYVTKDFVEITR